MTHDHTGRIAQLTAGLRSVAEELNTLRSQFEAGEPRPEILGLRTRLGIRLKRRLYRLMWWQTAQIRGVLELLERWCREEAKVVTELVHEMNRPDPGLSQRERDYESRLQWLAATSIERSRDLEARLVKFEALNSEEIARQADERTRELATRLERLEAAVTGEVARSASEAQGRNQVLQEINARLNSATAGAETVSRRLSEFGEYAHQTRAALSIQERRLALFLREARKGREDRSAATSIDSASHEEERHRYDSLYAEFEDLMRGSRDEIKSRQQIYIDFLRQNGIGSAEMPVLDLGCGRGEWLEVLRDSNVDAHGVDSNEVMIERCRSLDLAVTEADALGYVAGLRESSFGAVTAFHMVEHLPFDVLITLIDEALRVETGRHHCFRNSQSKQHFRRSHDLSLGSDASKASAERHAAFLCGSARILRRACPGTAPISRSHATAR
jgi:2-polyprenyl-3-methyl-5-hydroxy-6-metoxy-1,4-benzoquinol methylase